MPVAATAAGINVCLGFFREGKSAMRKKVLVAQFVTESNANIPYKTDLENYDLRFGEDAISQMNLAPYLRMPTLRWCLGLRQWFFGRCGYPQRL